jgi:hypothetical protein
VIALLPQQRAAGLFAPELWQKDGKNKAVYGVNVALANLLG